MHNNLCQLEQYIYCCCQNIVYCRGRISSDCAANTTEALINFLKVCTVDSSLLFHFFSSQGVLVDRECRQYFFWFP